MNRLLINGMLFTPAYVNEVRNRVTLKVSAADSRVLQALSEEDEAYIRDISQSRRHYFDGHIDIISKEQEDNALVMDLKISAHGQGAIVEME